MLDKPELPHFFWVSTVELLGAGCAMELHDNVVVVCARARAKGRFPPNYSSIYSALFTKEYARKVANDVR